MDTPPPHTAAYTYREVFRAPATKHHAQLERPRVFEASGWSGRRPGHASSTTIPALRVRRTPRIGVLLFKNQPSKWNNWRNSLNS